MHGIVEASAVLGADRYLLSQKFIAPPLPREFYAHVFLLSISPSFFLMKKPLRCSSLRKEKHLHFEKKYKWPVHLYTYSFQSLIFSSSGGGCFIFNAFFLRATRWANSFSMSVSKKRKEIPQERELFIMIFSTRSDSERESFFGGKKNHQSAN